MKKTLKAALLTTVITFAGFANAGGLQNFDICEVDESVFVNQVGGFAVGTAFTASVAGDSVLMIATESAVFIATAPAVSTVVATSAVVASSAYVLMKTYCNANVVTNLANDLHQAAVKGTVETITTVAGTRENMIKNLSEDMREIHDTLGNVGGFVQSFF